MQTPIERPTWEGGLNKAFFFWVLTVTCGVISCDSSGPQTSSSSHWLVCVDDASCENLPVDAFCAESGKAEGYCVDSQGEPIELLPSFEAQFRDTAELQQAFSYETGAGIRNGDLQSYTQSPDNVFVDFGELVIRAMELDGEYSSGSVELKESMLFGRVEAVIKTDVGSGAQPSLWLLPSDPGEAQTTCVDGSECSDSTWPAWGGIVVMSGRADGTTFFGLSYASDNAGVLNLTEDIENVELGSSISSEYHRYALEWGPQRMDWFVDNALVHSVDLNASEIYHPEGVNPFRQAFRVKLSLAVGGLVEAPTPEDYPRAMRVQSLRVLKYE